mgnify:CR=1 FL=1
MTQKELEKKVQSIQVVSPETAKAVTKMLTQSMNNGKTTFKMDKYNVAGKTGTSNKPLPTGGYSNTASYASAIGYLPSSDPQILIYVCIEIFFTFFFYFF